MRQQHDQAALVKRWRLGQAVAAERQRRLLAEEGPRPAQAVAESLSALSALEAMGLWPGPRDEISELGVERVRRRWSKVQKRAKRQAQSPPALSTDSRKRSPRLRAPFAPPAFPGW